MKSELKKIETQNINKENEIQQVKEKMHQLTTNKDELEKFARERVQREEQKKLFKNKYTKILFSKV